MFTKYLNQMLKDDGCDVIVNGIHPGIVKTDLFQSVTWTKVSSVL